MEIAAPAAPPLHGERRKAFLVGWSLAGMTAVVMAAAISAAGADRDPALVALARAAIAGVPMAVGLYAWSRRTDERFGLLLVAIGGTCALASLAEAHDEVAYAIGRIFGWVAQVLVVYAILAFAAGRLANRTDRILVAASATTILVFFAPQLVVAESLLVPNPFTSCTQACPENAFFALETEPWFVGGVLRPAGALAIFFVMAAVVVRLAQHHRRATPLGRRMYAPVLAVGALYATVLGIAIATRQLDPSGRAIEAVSWVLALAIPVLALTFLAGLLRWRLFAGRALARLADCLREVPDAARLRRAFAEAFRDPTVEIVFPADGSEGGWMDATGRPAQILGIGRGRTLRTVRRDGEVIAAVGLDEALEADARLVDAGLSMAGVVLENQRLAAETEAALREVRESRARLSADAERERRRIERDLHDGAQQRLVALRIELGLAEELIRRDPERGAARIRELEEHVEEALEELRALSHGVYPALLADRGLAEALRAIARNSPLAVGVDADGVGRCAPEIEGAVYFCVLEALQNALKHAKGARRVEVRLTADPTELRFTVRDDDPGAPDGVRAGAGLTNMRDRMAAVGGTVTVVPQSGRGTTVRARVPLGAGAAALR